MKSPKDYTFFASIFTLLVILLVLGVSQLPAFTVGGVYIKRVNILSDIITRVEEPRADAGRADDAVFDTAALARSEAEALSFLDTAGTADAPHSETVPARTETWALTAEAAAAAVQGDPLALTVAPRTPIEDFGVDEPALAAFYAACLDTTDTRSVRVAVLGDSFIEGDIFTVDLREQLQDRFGGNGVGFVPFGTPMAGFRASVLHKYQGWTIHAIAQRNKLEEDLRDKFFVSGYLCIPQEEAYTRLQGTRFRNHLHTVNSARLLFINREAAQLDVTLNETTSRTFNPSPAEHVQQILINAPVHTIEVAVSQPEGFIGYGIILEDTSGAGVDNYSIRGNSGMTLYETNPSINRQIARMVGYDLIILQYGLNVMSAENLHYGWYKDKMINVIRYIQQCFPGASVLLMGVGDRGTLEEGSFVSMPSIPGMIRAQRGAAEETGVAFWSTFDAMGGENSMSTFVENKWAATDYTHIRHGGGREIAKQLVASLMQGARERQAEEARAAEKDAHRHDFQYATPMENPLDTLPVDNAQTE